MDDGEGDCDRNVWREMARDHNKRSFREMGLCTTERAA
jgi:hypothetical protein